MGRVELLAPAGDLERLKISLLYGADAVYIGGDNYSLRANAVNFSIDEIGEACLFAHKLGKKVYVTMNMVFHNEDLDGVYSYIDSLDECGVDAIIISDPSLIEYIKNKGIEVHISTQASTTNSSSVKYLVDQGVDRVVLARELNKDEIHNISKLVDTEVFIHGAMCTFYSGRCTLSNYISNRDSNRGGCSQVCRFAFESNGGKPFTMATKDLNMAKYISDLIECGVDSLKVEGRMRSLYYLAVVIGTYRMLIDLYFSDKLDNNILDVLEYRLSRVANREVSTHYFNKEADYNDQYYTGRSEVSNQDYLALITGYDHVNGCLIMVERNYFSPGDEVEIFTPSGEVYPYIINNIYDEDMNELEVARHPGQVLKLKFEKELSEYSMIRLIRKGDIYE